MVIKLQLFFFVLFFISSYSPFDAFAQSPCGSGINVEKIDEVLATADTIPNFRNAPGSLRYESKRLLQSIENKLAEDPVPSENVCFQGCRPIEKPKILFSSLPNKYLSDYNDKSYCEQLYRQTKGVPLEYNNYQFQTIELLSDWFSEFSQGKGADGNNLYGRCDRTCSPQYSNYITKQSKIYSLNASVVCGPARDKSDNKYILSTYLLWECVPEEK